MANSLTFKFSIFNKSIESGVQRGENSLYFDLIIDDVMVRRTEKPCTLDYIPCGKHVFYCIFYYESSTGVEKYRTQEYEFNADNEDVVFTLNLYYMTYERGNQGFDFGIGEVPVRDKKDRTRGGCYVATCVYGSYDCPQVWTLRRYRDYSLSKTWHGRLFIRTYYAISPKLVRLFGNQKWFHKIVTPGLNKMVHKLNENGVESTPYNDK